MEVTENSSSENLLTEASQIMGCRVTIRRKQGEAFEVSSPPQQRLAEEFSQKSPKPKKERNQVNQTTGKKQIELLQTSFPKPKREANRSSNGTNSPKPSGRKEQQNERERLHTSRAPLKMLTGGVLALFNTQVSCQECTAWTLLGG